MGRAQSSSAPASPAARPQGTPIRQPAAARGAAMRPRLALATALALALLAAAPAAAGARRPCSRRGAALQCGTLGSKSAGAETDAPCRCALQDAPATVRAGRGATVSPAGQPLVPTHAPRLPACRLRLQKSAAAAPTAGGAPTPTPAATNTCAVPPLEIRCRRRFSRGLLPLTAWLHSVATAQAAGLVWHRRAVLQQGAVHQRRVPGHHQGARPSPQARARGP